MTAAEAHAQNAVVRRTTKLMDLDVRQGLAVSAGHLRALSNLERTRTHNTRRYDSFINPQPTSD